MTANNLF